MITPPRTFPAGILQLVRFNADGGRETVLELPSSNFNRNRLQQQLVEMKMLNPTDQLTIIENNAF